jgi:hypothetical protein
MNIIEVSYDKRLHSYDILMIHCHEAAAVSRLACLHGGILTEISQAEAHSDTPPALLACGVPTAGETA